VDPPAPPNIVYATITRTARINMVPTTAPGLVRIVSNILSLIGAKKVHVNIREKCQIVATDVQQDDCLPRVEVVSCI
jgi:hypothetical protein